MKTQQTTYRAYNEMTRRYEEINPNEAELLPGQKVLRMFWCYSDQVWVTVPGQSIYTITADGDMQLTAE